MSLDKKGKDLDKDEPLSESKTKPSFFSMRSPTLDALVLKVKSMIRSSSDQGGLDKDELKEEDAKTDVSRQDDLKRDSLDKKGKIQQDDSLLDTDLAQQDMKKEGAEEGAFELELEKAEGAPKVHNDNLQSTHDSDTGLEKDPLVNNQPVDDDTHQDGMVSQDSVDDLAKMDSEIPEGVEADLADNQDVSSSQDKQDDVSDITESKVSDNRNGVKSPMILSGTIFKQNSVLGNLDAHVLQSFPRKKREDIKQ